MATTAPYAGFETYRTRLETQRNRKNRQRMALFFGVTLVVHVSVIGILLKLSAPDRLPPRLMQFEMEVVTPRATEPTPPPTKVSPTPRIEKIKPVAPPIPTSTPVSEPAPAANDATIEESIESIATEPIREQPAIVDEPPPVTPAIFNADYLNNPKPTYPAIARRMRLQGTVTLRVVVREDGLAQDIQVAQSSGTKILDDAAINAVRNWTFVPARRGAQAISDIVFVPIRFKPE